MVHADAYRHGGCLVPLAARQWLELFPGVVGANLGGCWMREIPPLEEDDWCQKLQRTLVTSVHLLARVLPPYCSDDRELSMYRTGAAGMSLAMRLS